MVFEVNHREQIKIHLKAIWFCLCGLLGAIFGGGNLGNSGSDCGENQENDKGISEACSSGRTSCGRRRSDKTYNQGED